MDSITKICKKCGKEVTKFPRNRRTCQECIKESHQKWVSENKDRMRENHKNWKKNNSDKVIESRKRYKTKNRASLRERNFERNKRNRIIVINAYGGKCACCGETILEFLAIDHINNDGNVMRKNKVHPENPCSWLIKNGFPKDSFQILCHNCNASKEYYGYCPHEKLREVSKTT